MYLTCFRVDKKGRCGSIARADINAQCRLLLTRGVSANWDIHTSRS